MTIEELNKLHDSELSTLVWKRLRVGPFNVPIDHNDAALVRAEIKRRSLQQRFCRLLAGSTPDPLIAKNYWWHLCNATPRETCIAALIAMEGVK